MNTDKLIEAIQILVEQEVKRQLQMLTGNKPVVNKKTTTESVYTKTKIKTPSIAKAILGNEKKVEKLDEIVYTKNPILNKILNDTKQSMGSKSGLNEGYPGMPPIEEQFAEYKTMPTNINPIAPNPFTSPNRAGLGVQTGNDALDKALNRNYSELVKRFNKK
jgi:hypothetical protein